jgi:hypothetical protein
MGRPVGTLGDVSLVSNRVADSIVDSPTIREGVAAFERRDL